MEKIFISKIEIRCDSPFYKELLETLSSMDQNKLHKPYYRIPRELGITIFPITTINLSNSFTIIKRVI